jgi:hypothetical protein
MAPDLACLGARCVAAAIITLSFTVAFKNNQNRRVQLFVVAIDGLTVLAVPFFPDVLRALWHIGLPLFHELGWLIAIALFLSFLETLALLQWRAAQKIRRECPEEEYELAESPSDDATHMIISGLLLVIWPLTLLIISPKLFVLGLALGLPVVILTSCELAARYEESRCGGKTQRKRTPGLFAPLFGDGRQKADGHGQGASD